MELKSKRGTNDIRGRLLYMISSAATVEKVDQDRRRRPLLSAPTKKIFSRALKRAPRRSAELLQSAHSARRGSPLIRSVIAALARSPCSPDGTNMTYIRLQDSVVARDSACGCAFPPTPSTKQEPSSLHHEVRRSRMLRYVWQSGNLWGRKFRRIAFRIGQWRKIL